MSKSKQTQKTQIKNGKLVTASGAFDADLWIEGEKILAIGKDLRFGSPADQVVDAGGCLVFPGGIDAHTHMELPFMGTHSSDDFESGTLAALHGGTTSIIDFAIQTPGDSLQAGLNRWHEKAKGKAVGDYSFHMAVTDFNGNTKTEIQNLVQQQGVSSFKVFMAYKGALMIDDRQILGLMDEVKKYGGIVTTHCENGDLAELRISQLLKEGKTTPEFHALARPPICEAEATGRVMDLAYQGGHPLYIVHLTCELSLNRVRQATLRNQKVHVETCVQYLLLDDKRYKEPDFGGSKYVMSPPLRTPSDQEALWAGLRQNLIEVVATDHCPFCMDQKRRGEGDFSKIPNGGPGVENRMELLFSEGVKKGRISPSQFVEITSTAPARIFGMDHRKGSLAIGSDADLVIFDPNHRHTLSAKSHHMNCDYSLYEGWKVEGKCRQTFLRGTLAIDQGKALVAKGFGEFISRQPHVRSGGAI